MTEPSVVTMFHYRHEETCSSVALGAVALAINTHPGLDERTDKPGPDGSLVVNAIALSHTAFIMRRIAGCFGCQRAEAEGSPQPLSHGLDNSFCAFALNQRDSEPTDCENLIRPEQFIHFAGLVVDIDDIVQVAALFIPEASAKVFLAAQKRFFPFLIELAGDPKGI